YCMLILSPSLHTVRGHRQFSFAFPESGRNLDTSARPMSHWDGGIGCSVSSGKTKKPAFGAWAGGSSSVSADSAESSESTEASPSGSVTSISGSGSAASETPSSPVNIESTGPSPSSALDENAGPWPSTGVEVCGPPSYP